MHSAMYSEKWYFCRSWLFQLDHLNVNYDYISSAYKKPTYGELIDLLEEVEQESPNNESLLYSKFQVLYPNIYVGHPRRFYETLTCLAAPTKSSLREKVSLTGSLLTSYLANPSTKPSH